MNEIDITKDILHDLAKFKVQYFLAKIQSFRGKISKIILSEKSQSVNEFQDVKLRFYAIER